METNINQTTEQPGRVAPVTSVTDPLQDYDTLECWVCEKPCKPVKIKKNGTVVYETHNCNNGDFSFAIDVDGNLID